MTTSNKDNIHFIRGSTTDGDYLVKGLGSGFTMTEISYIHFFDSSGNRVTPTAGTVKVTMSPDGVVFRDVDSGTFNAVDAYDPTRTPPNGLGLAREAIITLLGIVGADSFVACVWRG